MEEKRNKDLVTDGAAPASPPVISVYSREGFNGAMSTMLRAHPGNQFSRIVGEHAPRRLDLSSIASPDSEDPSAMPMPLLHGRTGITVSLSTLRSDTPYILRNTEFDEFHFVHMGVLDFVTNFGRLRVEAGEFVYIGRSVSYRIESHSADSLRVIVEMPGRFGLAPSLPFGIVTPGDCVPPDCSDSCGRSGPVEMRLTSFDGVTRYFMNENPLTLIAHLGGPLPIWKLPFSAVGQVMSHGSRTGAPPAQFAGTSDNAALFFNISSRNGPRPPVHDNADYDEVIFYHAGPAAWGGIDQPATLTWVPKGAPHWGGEEDVPAGYRAWLLETTDTLRLTDEARKAAKLMETSSYDFHQFEA